MSAESEAGPGRDLAAPAAGGEVVDLRCHLTLTPKQAEDLYWRMESDDCPHWWETPLSAIQPAIRAYIRYEAPWTVPGTVEGEA